MNGMTAVKRIREMQTKGELRGHVPVIAVTANARIEQVEASIRGGMDDVMAKPFLMGELLPKMERLLGSQRAGDGVRNGVARRHGDGDGRQPDNP